MDGAPEGPGTNEDRLIVPMPQCTALPPGPGIPPLNMEAPGPWRYLAPSHPGEGGKPTVITKGLNLRCAFVKGIAAPPELTLLTTTVTKAGTHGTLPYKVTPQLIVIMNGMILLQPTKYTQIQNKSIAAEAESIVNMKGVATPQFALCALNSPAVTTAGRHGIGVKGMATPQLDLLAQDSTAITKAGICGALPYKAPPVRRVREGR